ncbi:hypothetical protein METH109765_17335 [Mesobacillus thioparans]
MGLIKVRVAGQGAELLAMTGNIRFNCSKSPCFYLMRSYRGNPLFALKKLAVKELKLLVNI